jgi:NTP pyrophosphatase (non-canonical NTP hydrolase)
MGHTLHCPDFNQPSTRVPAYSHDYVLQEIGRERMRQHRLKSEGRFKYTPSEVPPIRGHAMLSEECGEVARAALALSGYVQENLTIDDLYTECIHVAAVAMAMAQGLIDGTSQVADRQ